MAVLFAFGCSSSSDTVAKPNTERRGEACAAREELVALNTERAELGLANFTREQLARHFSRRENALAILERRAPAELRKAFGAQLERERADHRRLLDVWGDGDGHPLREQALAADELSIENFVLRSGKFDEGDTPERDDSDVFDREFRAFTVLTKRCTQLRELTSNPESTDRPPAGRIVYTDVTDWQFRGFTTPDGDPFDVAHVEGNVTHAAASPDGRRLAYSVTADDGDPHVWITDLEDGSHERVSTTGAYNECPTWSPEGERLAFDTDDSLLSLYDGGAIRHIPAPDPDWEDAAHCADFIDDDTIVVERALIDIEQPSLWRFEVDGGAPQPFHDPDGCFVVWPRRSPDGSRLAVLYSCSDPAESGLFVGRPDGTGFRRVIAGQAAAFDWSPDGEWLVFGHLPLGADPAHPDLWIARADGSSARRVASSAAFPTWFPA